MSDDEITFDDELDLPDSVGGEDNDPYDLEGYGEFPPCWLDEARGSGEVFSFGEKGRAWNWLELDRPAAHRLWAFLFGFVSFYNARYGERIDTRIPPCWAEHGAIVEELTTLALARWHAFCSEHGSIGGAQYWHSYTLPSFQSRVKEWLGDDLLYCQQGRHQTRTVLPVEGAAYWKIRTEIIAGMDLSRRSSVGSRHDQATARQADGIDPIRVRHEDPSIESD